MLIFYIFSFLAILSAILVVSMKSIMHSALFLALSLLSVAGIFAVLNADFLCVVQILIYAGGVMVLILFAVMLTQKIAGVLPAQTNEQKIPTIAICIILFFILFILIKGTEFQISEIQPELLKGTTPLIGKLLITTYVLPFEIASVVLLVAMIGVIVLAKKQE